MYRLSGHNGLRPTGLRPLFRPEVSTLFAYKLEKNVRYCYRKLPAEPNQTLNSKDVIHIIYFGVEILVAAAILLHLMQRSSIHCEASWCTTVCGRQGESVPGGKVSPKKTL